MKRNESQIPALSSLTITVKRSAIMWNVKRIWTRRFLSECLNMTRKSLWEMVQWIDIPSPYPSQTQRYLKDSAPKTTPPVRCLRIRQGELFLAILHPILRAISALRFASSDIARTSFPRVYLARLGDSPQDPREKAAAMARDRSFFLSINGTSQFFFFKKFSDFYL